MTHSRSARPTRLTPCRLTPQRDTFSRRSPRRRALANMASPAAYRVWSTLIIALDVLIIYALAVHGREVRH